MNNEVLEQLKSGGFDNISIETIIKSLHHADGLYFNYGNSPFSDRVYDKIKSYAKSKNPTDSYFIGIGSEVRGGKVKLPYQMGSLNQVEVGEISNWISKNNLQKEDLVISDKMDGISVMIVYDEMGKQKISYSRGNGIEGADISRHVSKIKNVPKQVKSSNLVVRAEIEISENSFQELKEKLLANGGSKSYKNARNLISGLMNRKENPSFVFDYITVIAYEMIDSDFRGSKADQLETLKYNGFTTTYYSKSKGSDLSDNFLKSYIKSRKKQLDFAIDGIVIDVNSNDIRKKMIPTKETLNPDYSIKYKTTDESNFVQTTVLEVEWNISKAGYLKPRLTLEAVELSGVTIKHATGYNAKYIIDNDIGVGTVVLIERSGDVIPNVVEVVKSTKANMPSLPWEWNDTKVDAVLKDKFNTEIIVQQVIDFFTSLEISHLKEGTVRQLFLEYKFTNFSNAITTILNLSENNWYEIIGVNGHKIFTDLHKKLDNISLYVLMGSLPFFGRGVGKRRFKKLEETFGTKDLNQINIDKTDMLFIGGFQQKTVDKIYDGMELWFDFLNELPDYVTIKTMENVDNETGSLNGQKIVFTGFRDKELGERVNSAGGELQSGVTKQTTMVVAKDINSNSGKVKKVRDKGIKIIDRAGLNDLLDMIILLS